jgi:hypothetical protein
LRIDSEDHGAGQSGQIREDHPAFEAGLALVMGELRAARD